MTESVSSPTCPNCGAPLSLLPDGTCRWCHAPVLAAPVGSLAGSGGFAELGASWEDGWTLGAPPGAKHSIPWDMAGQLVSPAKEIFATLGTGRTQPGMVAIAVTHKTDVDLDFCFCLLMNDLITAGLMPDSHDAPATYLEVCDLLDAVALFKGTDPQWAQSAQACAATARTEFAPAWQQAVAGDDPDPFQAELLGWIAHQLTHPGGGHFWSR